MCLKINQIKMETPFEKLENKDSKISHINNNINNTNNTNTTHNININEHNDEININNISDSEIKEVEPEINNNNNNINNRQNTSTENINPQRESKIPDQAVININSLDYFYSNSPTQPDFTELLNNTDINSIRALIIDIVFELDSSIKKQELEKSEIIENINFNIFLTLKIIINNVLKDPDNMKYRELKYTNTRINLILLIPGVDDLLSIIGFEEILFNVDSLEKALVMLVVRNDILSCALEVVENMIKNSESLNNRIGNNSNTSVIDGSNPQNIITNTNSNTNFDYIRYRNENRRINQNSNTRNNILNILRSTANIRSNEARNNNNNNNINGTNNVGGGNINGNNNHIDINSSNNRALNVNGNNNSINRSNPQISSNTTIENTNSNTRMLSNNRTNNLNNNINHNNGNNYTNSIKETLKQTAYIRTNSSNNNITNSITTFQSITTSNNNNNNNNISTLSNQDFINLNRNQEARNNNNIYLNESIYSSEPTDKYDIIGKEALRLTNEFRRNNHLPELKWDSNIWKICYQHSKNMAERKVPIGHQGFNNRINSLPFSFNQANENVFYCSGYSSNSIASLGVEGWIKSPGHKKNLMSNTNFCAVACYERYGQYYLTQIFIRR